MAEGKAVKFHADDGSVIRAGDFGVEFDERYLTRGNQADEGSEDDGLR